MFTKRLLVVILCGAFAFLLIEFIGNVTRPTQPEQCVTFQVMVQPDQYAGAVLIGDVQLCGTGLYFTGIKGPSEKTVPQIGGTAQ